MKTEFCKWCFGGVEKGSEEYPYCSRNCFDAHISYAIEIKSCKIRERICELRDDAEKRVANIEGLGTDKLLPTKNYFQARADVLNDLLSVMNGDETDGKSCSCETHSHPFQH